jgi:hypothetical protein
MSNNQYFGQETFFNEDAKFYKDVDIGQDLTVNLGSITASSFIKSGGTASEFLKADGSVDSSTYLTSYTETDTLNSVTSRGNSTSNGISVGVLTATRGNFTGIITSTGANISGVTTASSFVKSGGTSSQFLKADGSVDSTNYADFASGTTLLFYQASAPTGWTKQTTHNDKALRVVSGTGGGSGGSTAFTSVFASQTPSGSITVTNNSFTLSNTEIPSHTHEFGADDQIASQGGYDSLGTFPYDAISNTDGGGQRLRTRTDTVFGGAAHTHNNTANFSGSSMNFAVQYIDIILCSKD